MGRYHFPVLLLSARIPSFLFGRRRSLSGDIDLLFRAVGAIPRVTNADALPAAGPCVLVMNHFHRADIPAWWPAMAVYQAAATQLGVASGRRIRLIVASQWTFENRLLRTAAEPLTRFMIERVAHAYDFLTIEPVALGSGAAAGRAQSMRRILAAAHATAKTGDVLWLAPEGGDTPGGALAQPPAGAGRFMLMFASAGLSFAPVGAYAEAAELVVNFGEPFRLQPPSSLAKHAADAWAAAQVMNRIATLLPPELRGAYHGLDQPLAAR